MTKYLVAVCRENGTSHEEAILFADHLAAVKDKGEFVRVLIDALEARNEQIIALRGELTDEKEWSEALHGNLLAQIEENKKMLLSFQEHFTALKGRHAEEIERLREALERIDQTLTGSSCSYCRRVYNIVQDALKQKGVKGNDYPSDHEAVMFIKTETSLKQEEVKG